LSAEKQWVDNLTNQKRLDLKVRFRASSKKGFSLLVLSEKSRAHSASSDEKALNVRNTGRNVVSPGEPKRAVKKSGAGSRPGPPGGNPQHSRGTAVGNLVPVREVLTNELTLFYQKTPTNPPES